MRVIIAGSRCINNPLMQIEIAVRHAQFPISYVVSGTARGVDRAGELYAQRNMIPVIRYPAAWEIHGASAGYIRNRKMAENADALIAIWDGKSNGTRHMIEEAEKIGLKVYVHRVGVEQPVDG